MRIRGLLLLALALLASGALWLTARGAHASDRPHVLLILIDTLRADHLGVYGYSRDTSPHIDALAGEGVLFTDAHSVAPWTNPTIATLFTGRYPQAVLPAAQHAQAIQQELPEELETLAESLGGAGYHTVGLVDHPGLVPGLHWSQGFDEYVRLYRLENQVYWANTRPELILEKVREAVRSADDGPLFLYLHLVYPHRPYDPPEPYRELFGPGFEEIRRSERDGIVNTYDAEIRFTDDVVADVLDVYRERGLLENTWVVLTSDHGEAFWEHGVSEHGHSFDEELLHVPLVVRPPDVLGLEPAVVDERVSHVDLVPTLLHMADVAPPEGLDGRSYLPLIRGESHADRGTVFGESPSMGNVYRTAVWRGPYKLVSNGLDDTLYDLEQDPGEHSPLQGREELRAELHEAIQTHRAANDAKRGEPQIAPEKLDEETRARLRALGYTDS